MYITELAEKLIFTAIFKVQNSSRFFWYRASCSLLRVRILSPFWNLVWSLAARWCIPDTGQVSDGWRWVECTSTHPPAYQTINMTIVSENVNTDFKQTNLVIAGTAGVACNFVCVLLVKRCAVDCFSWYAVGIVPCVLVCRYIVVTIVGEAPVL